MLLLIQVINYALALLFWLIIGRYVLRILSGGRKTFFSDIFRRGTDPWFGLMRRITPAGISDRHIPVLSLLMLINLRLLLAVLASSAQ
jgi:hypothetical protein